VTERRQTSGKERTPMLEKKNDPSMLRQREKKEEMSERGEGEGRAFRPPKDRKRTL